MSDNLDFDRISAAGNKYDTINTALGKADGVLSDSLSIAFESGDSQAITLTTAQAIGYSSIVVTDNVAYTGSTPHTNTLTFPADETGKIHARNSSGRLLDIQVSGQTNAPVVELESYASTEIYCDGSDVRRVNNILMASFVLEGTLPTLTRFAKFVIPHRCWLRIADDGSSGAGNNISARCLTGPGAVFTVTIFDAAVPFASFDIDSAGALSAINITATRAFDRGDVLSAVTPGSFTGSPADLMLNWVLEH